MFDQIIPDENIRRKIYQALAAVGLLLGSIQVVFLSTQSDQPGWLTAALGVYTFLGGGSLVLSQANTRPVAEKVSAEPVVEVEVITPGPVGVPDALTTGSKEPTGIGLMAGVDGDIEINIESEVSPTQPGRHAAV